MSRAVLDRADARDCEVCGRAFRAPGRQRWCVAHTHVEIGCARCGREFMVKRGDLARRVPRFCSLKCANGSEREHAKYNGGLTCDRGRWLIVCRDRTRVAFYRGVMAAHIGRLLTPEEHVHHLNGDASDDRIENLQIVTRAEHMKIHMPEILWARRA